MGRERHGRRLPRGRPRLPPGLLAAAVLSGLALFAFPLAAAGGGTRPWSDTQGPSIANLALSANPVVPPDDVVVTALARDNASNVSSGEFYFDAPGPSGFSAYRMMPSDGVADSLTESLFWTSTYDVFTQRLSAGSHVLYVHAKDAVGNWGDYATLDFYVGSPQTIGPSAYLFGVSPANLTLGASVTITGSVVDRYGQTVRAAEFFLDRPGADGTGWAMNASDGAFDGAAEAVVWSGVLAAPFGNHTVWMHGSNGNVWGPAASLPFTLRAPAFTLALVVTPTSAGAGDLVTYSLSFENHGNADASTLWVNVTLPPTVTYVDDTVAGVGGTGSGTDYVFGPVTAPSYAFDIHARVVATATDGRPLDASATLDLTNDLGWDFPAISASASGLVLAPEVDLALSLPAILNAGEVSTLVVTIDNTGIRVIPTLTLAVTVPPDAQVVGDTAGSQGGQRIAPNAWRFANLPPGRLSFDVSAAVSSLAVDRETLSCTATADYVSRLGDPKTIAANVAATVAKPVVTPSLAVDPPQVAEGGQALVTIRFDNAGSAIAKSVRVAIVLPVGLTRIGGDPPTSIVASRYTWDFVSVGPGTHSISLLVAARSLGTAGLRVDVTFTSPNGVPFPTLGVDGTIDVIAAQVPAATLLASAGVVGAALGMGGLVATERGKTAFLFLFLPLYTRLKHEKVLDHETRGMIRGYIVANPGDHYNAIKEALELPNGTLAYHIQVLQKEMIVKSVKDGKFRRFYPYEMRVPETGQPTKIQRVILDLIRVNPGITLRDAAGFLGLGSSTVSYHLERLEELERIESRREGISKHLYVKGDLGPET